MRHAVLLSFLLTASATLRAQDLSDVRRLYDAGKFKEVISAVQQSAAEDTTPRLQYLVALSHEKLKNVDAARQAYQRLAEGDVFAWAAIGRSALALLDKQFDEALEAAEQAIEGGAALPEAHYQRGLVLMMRRQWGDAAAAFGKATTLDPAFAAAHYYGGLAESRANRIDRMAAHFEAFLKLAPTAPERPEVESIMRTVRGR